MAQAEALIIQIKDHNIKNIVQKKRRCLTGKVLFNEEHKVKLSFSLSFALRLVSIVNVMEIDEIFN